jgi:hypothetical protein
MTQDRLNRLLAAAAEAVRDHPDWREGSDDLCIILADADATVLTTRGFDASDLVQCLEFLMDKVRVGTRPPPAQAGSGAAGGAVLGGGSHGGQVVDDCGRAMPVNGGGQGGGDLRDEFGGTLGLRAEFSVDVSA